MGANRIRLLVPSSINLILLAEDFKRAECSVPSYDIDKHYSPRSGLLLIQSYKPSFIDIAHKNYISLFY